MTDKQILSELLAEREHFYRETITLKEQKKVLLAACEGFIAHYEGSDDWPWWMDCERGFGTQLDAARTAIALAKKEVDGE